MKRDPRSVETAVRKFKVNPRTTLLVGDSIADIIAAHSVGVCVIAFANKPNKLEQFRLTSADVIVTSMAVTALAIERVGKDAAQ